MSDDDQNQEGWVPRLTGSFRAIPSRFSDLLGTFKREGLHEKVLDLIDANFDYSQTELAQQECARMKEDWTAIHGAALHIYENGPKASQSKVAALDVLQSAAEMLTVLETMVPSSRGNRDLKNDLQDCNTGLRRFNNRIAHLEGRAL